MNKRTIGNTQLKVAPLSFGCNVFGWTADKEMSFKLLDRFVDAGLNLIDTADVYPVWHPGNKGGESESIIGEWFKKTGNREKVVLATKVGMKMAPGLGCESLSRDYIFKSVEDSLKRLGVETIDLYQAHNDDPDTPLEETMEAFNELIKQGKVRFIGASNYKRDRLALALKVSNENNLARYECLQPEYNLYDRQDYELNLESLCEKENLGVISYFSLARGFLTGKYHSKEDLSISPRGKSIEKYLDDRGVSIVKALHTVAQEINSNPAQVALAWLMARPSITAPIASASKLDQIEDLIKAASLELSSEAIDLLTKASQYDTVSATN